MMTAFAVGSWMVFDHSKISEIFLPHDGPTPSDFVGKGIALHHRFVRLNPKAWEQAFNERHSIKLELFNGEAHTLKISTAESHDFGQQLVQGTVEGVPYGEFTLTKVGNSIAGVIDLPVGRRFTLVPCVKDVHCLVEPDHSLPINCGTGAPQPPKQASLESLIRAELIKLVIIGPGPGTGPAPAPQTTNNRVSLRVRVPILLTKGPPRPSNTNPLLWPEPVISLIQEPIPCPTQLFPTWPLPWL